MNERYEKLISYIIGFFVVQLLIIALIRQTFIEFLPFVLIVLLIINGILLLVGALYYTQMIKSRQLSITQILGREAKDALLFGDIGLVTFDKNYVITWMSEMFEASSTRFIGEKISSWIPQTSDLIQGNDETITVNYRNYVLKITRFREGNTLFVKDVTRQENALTNYRNNQIVLGLVHLDNYSDEIQYEDATKQALYDMNLRQLVLSWAKDHGMFVHRIQTDRFLVVFTEEIFQKLVNENFDILNTIRKASNRIDSSVTLSMAFARGTNEFDELESMAYRALELTQGRGGDQVAVKTQNQDIKYYGGNTQAQEKSSKVRVRVLANTLRDMVYNSENVIICGHKNMDFDCLGAAIGISNIVSNYNKEVCIVSNSGGLEEKLNKVYERHYEDLLLKHDFVDEKEALSRIHPSTLLIMVDHHSLSQSNAPEIINTVKKIAIIDHHRRTSDFNFNPMLAYIETAFSSTCEMITELFLYQRKPIELTELEATIMYTGILIDTNHFRVRSGSRTFEAVAQLRKLKANPSLADTFLKDTFEEFELKAHIMSSAQFVDGYVLISYDEKPINRTIMSQMADEALQIEGVEASFMIGRFDEKQTGVSARSKGIINVQVLMEKLGGGGHFTASAYQSETESVEELTEKIKQLIQHREEEINHESHTIS